MRSATDGSRFYPKQSPIFLFPTTSRLALGSTQPTVQQVRKTLPVDKVAGAWSLALTSIYIEGYERVDSYLHYPIIVHGAMVNKALGQFCL